jgi:mannosylglycerate hydrolase
MKKKLNIVFQTHWDREWYLPFEVYRYRLIHVMRRIIKALDHKEISTFILDGQTLPLDDYLETAEPSEKEKVLTYIKAGKIIIGPWYIAMDEFLVHGESMIRNLELGHQACQFYGNEQKLGYIPDTFGHVGQMPQILKAFGINDAMMWRGVHPLKSEFIWEGIDQSKCFTIFLSEGYYQPILNQDDYEKAVEAYIAKIEKLAHTDELLLTAGGDHLMPIDQPLDIRIQTLSKNSDDVSFEVTDYQTYINRVKDKVDIKDLEHIKGELRENTNCYILPNVLSTRSYLKINNQHLEDLMLGTIEPLVASQYLFSEAAPYTYIDAIWKNILKNQPHDSICGCSVDSVHQENEHRSQLAFQQIESLMQGIGEDQHLRPMQYYGDHHKKVFDDDQSFSLFNPHPYNYSGIINATLWLNEQSPCHQGFMIKDGDGHAYEVSLIKTTEKRFFASPLDYPPAFRKGQTYQVTFEVKDLKAMALTPFYCEPTSTFNQTEVSESYVIENKYIKVELHLDGTLSLTSHERKETLTGMHQFYSEMDCGDTYNYAKPEQDYLSVAHLSEKPTVIHSNHQSVMTYQLTLKQPEGLDATHQAHKDSFVESLITVELTLHHDQPMVYAKTIIDNQAKDHRLRLVYPLGQRIDRTVSDSVFELKERIANREESFVAQRLKEVPVVVDPSLSMIVCHKENENFVVFHRGLHEYQVEGKLNESILKHTLLRSVGYLSRDDFKTRGGAAGPNLETPEAQVLRPTTVTYAFGFQTQTTSLAHIYQQAKVYRQPVVMLKGVSLNKPHALIKLSHQEVILSSTRKISPNQIEIRLWNPYAYEQTIDLSSDYKMVSFVETNMLKENKKTVNHQIQLAAHEIKTIDITYEK